MRKIIIGLSIFLSAIFLLCCQEEKLDTVKDGIGNGQASSRKSEARMGPGFSYNFSTSSVSGEYYDPPGASRQYYLKASLGYVRSVTFTITKVGASSVNPTFRVYGGFYDCLKMSVPAVSSGTASATTFTDYSTGSKYKGYSWTPPLSAAAAGATATLTFNAYLPSGSSCVEGYFSADMTSPALIRAAGNYWDGDYLYFVKNSSL